MSEPRQLAMTVPTHRTLEGGGFPVRRPSPMSALSSPFLLLDEMGPVNWPPNEAIGAPEHPHRGFETVTYVLQGRMCHADSAGNSGVLGPGDVQWMTAGRGIIHSELPHPDFLHSGGVMHGFQLWVNLPAKHKMMAPRYQDIPASEIPYVTSDDRLVEARIIAGECLGITAVIETVIPIIYLHLTVHPGGSIEQDLPAEINAMVYCFEGAVSIGGMPVHNGQLGILTEGNSVILSVPHDSKSAAELLLLGGPEIDEPIARYGPFVMNTEDEIRQAITDFQTGQLA